MILRKATIPFQNANPHPVAVALLKQISSYNNDLKYSSKLCKTYLAKNLSSGFLCIVAQKSDLGVFKLLWEQFD